ncbi:hypothetical protein [Paenibacillus sp. GCM10027626]|uniref:hypothetical protein n=1 Tax=Paenibacillus sp. GCM10027626 TaxID=3273411 RepID=UPI003630DD27
MKRAYHFALASAAAVLIALAWLFQGGWLNTYLSTAAPDPSLSEDKDKLALHLFVSLPAGANLPGEADDFVRRAIEAKFNVQLTLSAVKAGDEYDTQLASLLAANDPPDMWLGLGTDGGASYALDNALADMTLFVSPATMPNYFKYWISGQELRQYQFHNKFMRAPVPYDKKTYRAYYIRKDWLDRLGLDVPTTYEQYYRVLHAFTYGDPDGNGLNDTYGFTTAGNGTGLSTDWPEYVNNGLLYPAYYKDNKLIDMQMDLRIKDVVTDILRVIDDGLVDPDWFLNKSDDAFNKAVWGKAGIVLGDTKNFAYDSNPDSLQARSKQINPMAEWISFNPFGNKPLRTAVSPGHPFVFSNKTAGLKPEKLKKTATILDWLAGEEGFLLTHYGISGKHYDRQGSVITLKPEAIEADIASKGRFLDIWSFFTPDTPEVLGLTVVDPRETERDKAIHEMITHIPVHEGVGTTLTPPLGIRVDTMRARQDELQVKMLFTDKSGEHWPEYREEIISRYKGEQIFKQYEYKIRAARKEK